MLKAGQVRVVTPGCTVFGWREGRDKTRYCVQRKGKLVKLSLEKFKSYRHFVIGDSCLSLCGE